MNKQGQTRLAQDYEYLTIEERRALEGEIVRKCLARNEQQYSFVENRNYKIVYRRYASLFFMVGVDNDENELVIFEFIHLLVETMDRHFGNVCELNIIFHLEKAHFMLEAMVMNGCLVETSKANILALSVGEESEQMGEQRGFKRRFMNIFTCFASNSARRLASRRSSSIRRPECNNKIKPESSLPAASPRRTPMPIPYRRKASHYAPLPRTSRGNHYRMGTEEREESLKDVIEYCKVFAHVPLAE